MRSIVARTLKVPSDDGAVSDQLVPTAVDLYSILGLTSVNSSASDQVALNSMGLSESPRTKVSWGLINSTVVPMRLMTSDVEAFPPYRSVAVTTILPSSAYFLGVPWTVPTEVSNVRP